MMWVCAEVLAVVGVSRPIKCNFQSQCEREQQQHRGIEFVKHHPTQATGDMSYASYGGHVP